MKEILSILSRAQKLKSLGFSGNMFSVALVEALVESLKKIPHLPVQELILDDAGLNDESACILAKFVRGKSSISTLCLTNNPGIGAKGTDSLRGLSLKRWVPSEKGVPGSPGSFEDIDTW